MNTMKSRSRLILAFALGLVVAGAGARAQSHRKVHLTQLGGQGFKNNLPYIEKLDGLDADIPPGEIKGFSCIPATATDYNDTQKYAPVCFVLTQ